METEYAARNSSWEPAGNCQNEEQFSWAAGYGIYLGIAGQPELLPDKGVKPFSLEAYLILNTELAIGTIHEMQGDGKAV